jgi:hypothetical protein
LIFELWHRFFCQPFDRSPEYIEGVVRYVRDFYFGASWNECYDLLEFIANHAPPCIADALNKYSNKILEQHLSGYRMAGGIITPITSPEELESIEEAMANHSLNQGAAHHFRAALAMLSDRSAPDHRNSIKESISAVESICKELTGNPSTTLGKALKPLQDKGVIHPALKKALEQLFGYTSDCGGIRHAMLDEPSLTFIDSKFMLVACTAFANYLVAKAKI